MPNSDMRSLILLALLAMVLAMAFAEADPQPEGEADSESEPEGEPYNGAGGMTPLASLLFSALAYALYQ
ncbi:hypothetical protein TCAL_05170 [Tigriopus californicus]|uniref:Uncharacterized protein n=1 Tax=Tigriopus californicus TaxID=6832 RepID=A0A553NPD3_TIGCA|nr:hypothetical protein TCAL_05170 [Tigriopus californicus]|eukprot:TCALIF_05170-PA protein Name:"Protein of unknown function" AED:0.14 eAED:0.14 QI:0/0/0.5/0.5/1/1/2/134/68